MGSLIEPANLIKHANPSPQVYGSWPATAAALAATPEVLHMSWQGLESLLAEAQQRAAWRSVSALMQQQEGHEQLSG